MNHNSKQSFITIPAGPNERQRARKRRFGLVKLLAN